MEDLIYNHSSGSQSQVRRLSLVATDGSTLIFLYQRRQATIHNGKDDKSVLMLESLVYSGG